MAAVAYSAIGVPLRAIARGHAMLRVQDGPKWPACRALPRRCVRNREHRGPGARNGTGGCGLADTPRRGR
ncbi:Hypothetical protein FRAAL0650 [Frankia alni ACN14a]|uniref:Uncharacterized protein n=1 Tax=Frankia alni (strain DSM 45986 / CECT 9034 / ACN14a) TaxID=326424 RepID=Q0RSY0_FRAAA|nr:Hypothetical protein FRAAL0650 [Frankia alni ACN14a]